MNLEGLAAQHAAPMVVKVLLEDDSVFEDNALRDELTKARGSLPAGSYFSISSCSSQKHPWEYLSSNPAGLNPIPGLEDLSERVDSLVTSLFSTCAEIAGLTGFSFTNDPKLVQKWIILVKDSNKSTTIGKTRYLSAILKKCMEENCILIRIDSSNPRKITGLVDNTILPGGFCARMENSPWGWLRQKIIDHITDVRKKPVEVTAVAQTVLSTQPIEAELMAIAKGGKTIYNL